MNKCFYFCINYLLKDTAEEWEKAIAATDLEKVVEKARRGKGETLKAG